LVRDGLRVVRGKYRDPAQGSKAPLDEVQNFLHVIDRNHSLFTALPVYVIECVPGTSAFVESLVETLPTSPIQVDLRPVQLALSEEDFFALDGHLRPSGHRRIAEVLAAAME
jgi:hypothetical protein